MKGTEPARIRLGVRRTFRMTVSAAAVLACILLVLAPQVLAQNRARDSERAIAILRDVFNFVRLNYVNAAAADTDRLLTGALQGMLEAVGDDHTKFLDRDEIDELNDMTIGEFGGVASISAAPTTACWSSSRSWGRPPMRPGSWPAT